MKLLDAVASAMNNDEHCPYCPQCGWWQIDLVTAKAKCYREFGSKKCQQTFEHGKAIGRAQGRKECMEEIINAGSRNQES